MMTNDPRTLKEVLAAHPAPWQIITLPIVINGATQLRMADAVGNEVPLFTALRIVELVLNASKASATSPA